MGRFADRARVVSLAIGIGLTQFVPSAEAEGLPQLVKTMSVVDPGMGATRSFFGEVSSKQTVDLGFQVSGRVIEFFAPEGTVIPQGTVIAQLDPVPFEIEVERATLTLDQAQRQAQRFEQLAGSTISAAQVQDAQTEVSIAQVALRDAEYALNQTTLVAPFDAMVASRQVANFSTVAAGTQIVRLHDLSEMRVEIEVPEVLIQQLGETPDITFQARFPGSDAEYPLFYREVNAETSQIGQTFRVTLALEAASERYLLPGASVVVAATLNTAAGEFHLPNTAIAINGDAQTAVFTVEDDGEDLTLRRSPVTLGVSNDGRVAVLSGIKAGEEIVVGGVQSLSDGQAVRRFLAQY
ncbi:MAG: efflux RND transporter periplasmic adaptor subunit [Pseudomonadota bacterium]